MNLSKSKYDKDQRFKKIWLKQTRRKINKKEEIFIAFIMFTSTKSEKH